MVAQRECVRVRGSGVVLWVGTSKKGPCGGGGGVGAIFFFFPLPLHSRLQSTDREAAKVCQSESQGSKSRPAAGETNKDARKHTAEHEQSGITSDILSFGRAAKANATRKEARMLLEVL